jgi:hypothetical protein
MFPFNWLIWVARFRAIEQMVERFSKPQVYVRSARVKRAVALPSATGHYAARMENSD